MNNSRIYGIVVLSRCRSAESWGRRRNFAWQSVYNSSRLLPTSRTSQILPMKNSPSPNYVTPYPSAKPENDKVALFLRSSLFSSTLESILKNCTSSRKVFASSAPAFPASTQLKTTIPRCESRILVRGAQWSFDRAQNLLKIGGFPLKKPEKCMILKKSWRQVRGAQWSFDRAQNLLKNRGFSLKEAWKVHDFEEILEARAAALWIPMNSINSAAVDSTLQSPFTASFLKHSTQSRTPTKTQNHNSIIHWLKIVSWLFFALSLNKKSHFVKKPPILSWFRWTPNPNSKPQFQNCLIVSTFFFAPRLKVCFVTPWFYCLLRGYIFTPAPT